MIIIKEGKKELVQAFIMYRCTFCGLEGLKARTAAKPYGHPQFNSRLVEYTDDSFQGPQLVNSIFGTDRRVCPNCAMGMDELYFKNAEKAYVETLLGKTVQVWIDEDKNVSDYNLTEEDLYLKT